MGSLMKSRWVRRISNRYVVHGVKISIEGGFPDRGIVGWRPSVTPKHKDLSGSGVSCFSTCILSWGRSSIEGS